MTEELNIERYVDAPIALTVTEEGMQMLETKYASVPDCADKDGYSSTKKIIRELVGLRTSLEQRRKELKNPVIRRGEKIDMAAKQLTARIEALEERHKKAKKAEDDRKKAEKDRLEKIEQERLKGIKDGIAQYDNMFHIPFGSTVEKMQNDLDWLLDHKPRKEYYQEYMQRAEQSCAAAIAQLEVAIDSETKRKEAEAQRIAEQKRIEDEQRVERERIEAERKRAEERQRVEDERLATERRKFEEEKAEHERVQREKREQEESDRKKREAIEVEKRAKEAEALAKREREIEKEKQRIEDEKQRSAAEKKRLEAEEIERQRKKDLAIRAAKVLEQNKVETVQAMMDANDIGGYDAIFDAIVDGTIPHIKYTE